MRKKPVTSSVVIAAGYDAEHRILEVKFRNGRTYYYLDVPPAEYQRFMAADSVGAYLNEVIKPNYRAAQVRGGKVAVVPRRA